MLQKRGPRSAARRPPVPTVLDIADASRAAALTFLRGTGLGWGADDLAAWLAGPYRAATSRSRAVVQVGATAPLGVRQERELERMLLSTREQLLELLITRELWSESGLARRAVASHLVVAVRDSAGTVGYAPVDQPGLPLLERIGALFLADYLTRPRDYEDLCVCEDCGDVSFSWAPSHQSYCVAPPAKSEVVVRDDALSSTDRGCLGR